MIKYTWLVYIIRCKDKSLYTGITSNLRRRLQSHSNGTGAKYTKGRGPFQLLYTEGFFSRSEASQREFVLKKLSLKQKLNLIYNTTENK